MTTTDQPEQDTGRIAIYTRKQHSQAQMSHPQIYELVAFAIEHGYSTERITVFEEGSTTGNVAILKREAFDDLMKAITLPEQEQALTRAMQEGSIRAILVYSADRLFGYASTQDVVSFIQTCLTHGVTVITPTTEYDFSNPSAESRNFFGNDKMRFIGSSIVSTHTLGQLLSG